MISDENTHLANILNEIVDRMNLHQMKQYNLPFPQTSSNAELIRQSAINDSAPMTVVYTPVCTGKSYVLKNRIKACISAGTEPNRILILSMNLSKAKESADWNTDLKSHTFQEFTDILFDAIFPGIQTSNDVCLSSTLQLSDPSEQSTTGRLAQIFRLSDAKKKELYAILFVRQHPQETINWMMRNKMASSLLKRAILLTVMYYGSSDFRFPDIADTILVNSIQNMPIGTVCILLTYASMAHANLFITGYPDDGIYEFTGAFANAMNVIARRASIIRLHEPHNCNPDIMHFANLDPSAKTINNIEHLVVNNSNKYDYQTPANLILNNQPLRAFMEDALNQDKLLILCRNRHELEQINIYLSNDPTFSNYSKLDISAPKTPESIAWKVASGVKHHIDQMFPKVVSVHNILEQMRIYAANTYENPHMLEKLEKEIADINLPNENVEITMNTFIEILLKRESEKYDGYISEIENRERLIEMSESKIVLSTIHSAIDLRMPYVLTFAHFSDDEKDNNTMMRIAFSRASEKLFAVFLNQGTVKSQYQVYLEQKNTV